MEQIATEVAASMAAERVLDDGVEPIWDTEQAARYLQIHPRTLTRKAREGDIPGFNIGKHWRFRKRDLDAWIDSKVSCVTKLTNPVRVN